MHPFAELDEIGFIGDPDYEPTPEDIAFLALKGEEARQQYYAELGKSMTPEEIALYLLQQRGIYPKTTAAEAPIRSAATQTARDKQIARKSKVSVRAPRRTATPQAAYA